MDMEESLARLIAVGASVAANCQPCLASSIRKALSAGAGSGAVAQAIAIGRLVRQGAASQVDVFIASSPDLSARLSDLHAFCDCSS